MYCSISSHQVMFLGGKSSIQKSPSPPDCLTKKLKLPPAVRLLLLPIGTPPLLSVGRLLELVQDCSTCKNNNSPCASSFNARYYYYNLDRYWRPAWQLLKWPSLIIGEIIDLEIIQRPHCAPFRIDLNVIILCTIIPCFFTNNNTLYTNYTTKTN